MTYDFLILEKGEGIGVLYLNRPEALNALNAALLKELAQAVDDIAADEEIQVLIITGAGGKAFAAGADIKYMQPLSAVDGRVLGALGQSAFRKVAELEKPVIAVINGFALGGGCELAMSCDIRLASDKAKFGQPEVGLGITPGFGGTQLLPRIIGEGRAKELIFTGEVIGAEEAYRLGLVNRIYPADTLMDEARKLAARIAANAPLAVNYSKVAINRGMQADIDTGMAIEADLFGLCFSTEDQKNGMEAFLQKTKTPFKGK